MHQYANANCDECDGEGWCSYGGFADKDDGCKELPCQKCFPKSSWSDFEADREDE